VDEDAPLQPPTRAIEASVPAQPRGPVEPRRNERDKIANSLNIAKLQGMPMTELNTMAKDMGVENYGTMRKHEVIFHILQKNAERAGVLFSECWKSCRMATASCARKVSITYRAQKTSMFHLRRSAGLICRPVT
jgi:hypothetical protein